MTSRVERIVAQLRTGAAPGTLPAPARRRPVASDDDVVVVSSCRTAIGKAKKSVRSLQWSSRDVRRGGFKDTFAEEMLATVLRAVVERVDLDKSVRVGLSGLVRVLSSQAW